LLGTPLLPCPGECRPRAEGAGAKSRNKVEASSRSLFRPIAGRVNESPEQDCGVSGDRGSFRALDVAHRLQRLSRDSLHPRAHHHPAGCRVMQSFFLSMAALVALLSPALSADKQPLLDKAPALAAPAWNWTGCHADGLWGQSTQWIVRTPGGAFANQSLGGHEVDSWGGGAHACRTGPRSTFGRTPDGGAKTGAGGGVAKIPEGGVEDGPCAMSVELAA
jgi:hypothetical protein